MHSRKDPIPNRFVRVFLTTLAIGIASLTTAAAATRISTLAGTGVAGFAGDGGPAVQAQLNNPYGISRGPDGALYVCDMESHRVRRVTNDGRIMTVAGTGKRGYAGDGGPALQAELNEPYEVRFDRAGNMFFVEMRNAIVRRVDMKTGTISTVAGTGKEGFSGDGGPAVRAQLRQPHSIQFDASGDLYICDIGNNRIRKVDMKTGIISTFAGTGEKLPTPDGARFATAPLNGPRAIDFDKDGSLWLALREGNAICKLDLKNGTIRHVAGTGRQATPAMADRRNGRRCPARRASASRLMGTFISRTPKVTASA